MSKVKPARSEQSFRPLWNLQVADFLAALLVSSVIVLLSYTTKSFWGDEILSLRLASQDLGSLMESLEADYHPPLYFLLLKGWIGIAGQNELGLRIFQGLQGTVFSLLSLILFRTIFPATRYHPFWLVLITSAELWLFMPMLRYYLLASNLVLFSSLIFFCWLERDDLKSTILLTVSYVLVLYTDYPSSIIIVLHGFYLLVKERRKLRTMIIVYSGALILFIPWLVITIDQIGSLLGSVQIADLNTSPKVIPLKIGYALYSFILGEMTYPFEVVAIIVILVVGTTVVVSRPGKLFWKYDALFYPLSVVVGGVLFTSLLTTFISRHTSFIYTPSRTLFALPFFFMFAGTCYAVIQKSFLRYIFLAAFLLANVYGIYNWSMNRHFMMPVYATPWKEVVEDLKGKDGIILVDESLCYEYYTSSERNRYPELFYAGSVHELTNVLRSPGHPPIVYVVIMGRESTEAELSTEVVNYIRQTGIMLLEKKYLALDEDFRKIKSRILGRDTYDAKLTLYKYDFAQALKP